MLILILDDSELMLSLFGMVCTQLGHDPVGCVSVSDLDGVLSGREPEVVLCDLNMPGTDDPVRDVRARLPDARIVLISGTPQNELDALAVSRGVHGAISKDGGLAGVASALPALLESV